MGRYSSVQAYSDTNAGMRTVSYDQAKGGDKGDASAKKSVQPEKVVNPYGSAAGAGSGDFHLYRKARAREMQRIQHLDQDEKARLQDAEFQKMLETNKREAEERTERRRKKRQRQKEAKQRKMNLQRAGVNIHSSKDSGAADQEEEFTYVPQEDLEEKEKAGSNEQTQQPASGVPFANDGSFLEMMKRKLAEEEQANLDDKHAEAKPEATTKP